MAKLLLQPRNLKIMSISEKSFDNNNNGASFN